MKLTNIDFLELVWDHICVEGDFVFLSTKSPSGNWSDYAFRYSEGLTDRLEQWFDYHPAKKYDIYFCPLPYSKRKRNRKFVKRLNILWADIDKGDPYRIQPTLLWKSSPGNYQGLWLLDKKGSIDKIESLNKDLAYYIGADKGGWDLTQVLRVPGTINHKYDDNPRVRHPKDTEEIFSYRSLRKTVPSIEHSETKTDNNQDDLKRILKKHSNKIPPDIKRKLLAKKVMGDRSKVLWSIENNLFECGIPRKDILLLIKDSIWNKFKGRPEEDEILEAEIDKIIERKKKVKKKKEYEEYDDTTEFIIDSYDGLLSSLDVSPGWLVEGFWLNGSHGIVAGEPKTYKSILALDLAISIASGRNFLGKYEVHNPGPVIYIQNENAKWIMKDRVEKISYNKGLGGRARIRNGRLRVRFPEQIPLYFINTQAYTLNNEEHQLITQEIIKQYNPKLIIFDPLYLMYDGDLKDSKELNPMLQWLLRIKYEFNCSVLLIHHFNKGNKDNKSTRGGQRMLGSTTLHGWTESAWYVQADREEHEYDGDDEKAIIESNIIIEREFRGSGSPPKINLSLSMGSTGSTDYKVVTKVHHGKGGGSKSNLGDVEAKVLNFILVQKDPVSMRYISRELGISRTIIKESMDRLVESGAVEEISKGIYARF